MKQIITTILLLVTLFSFGKTVRVTRIIDGDTFETESGEKVRLIGINSPEISDIFGEEAKLHLSSLIENKIVELQSDHLSNDKDRYQRLLRYVVINNIDINKKMIADGFAFAYLKYNFKKSIDYKNAQILARETNNGIWGNSREYKMQNSKKYEPKIWKGNSIKLYFITSLIIVLIFIGIYYHFKKN